MKDYKTIGDLRKGIDAGEIKEEDLRIILDNDSVDYYLPDPNDPEDCVSVKVGGPSEYSSIKEL